MIRRVFESWRISQTLGSLVLTNPSEDEEETRMQRRREAGPEVGNKVVLPSFPPAVMIVPGAIP